MARNIHRKQLHEARAASARWAAEHPDPDSNPAEVLQWILNRATAQLKLAASKADRLLPSQMEVMTAFGPIPNKWIRLEEDLRKEVAGLALNMERVGLADRLVSLQEAKAELLVRALVAAAQDAGIAPAQVKRLGPALRHQLALAQSEVVEGGTATDLRAA